MFCKGEWPVFVPCKSECFIYGFQNPQYLPIIEQTTRPKKQLYFSVGCANRVMGGGPIQDGIMPAIDLTAINKSLLSMSQSILRSGLLLAMFGTLSSLQAVSYYTRANGDYNDPNAWSTIACGNAAAGSVPTPADDVTICPGHTITLGADITVNNYAATGGTLNANTFNIYVNGSWDNSITSTFNKGTSTVNFTATTAGNTVFTGGDTFYKVYFNGVGGSWTLTDNLGTTFCYLYNGTLDSSTYDISSSTFQMTGGVLNNGASGTVWTSGGDLNQSGGTINANGKTFRALYSAIFNGTFNAGTSTVELAGTVTGGSNSYDFTVGANTFNHVTLSGAETSANTDTYSLSGPLNLLGNLTINNNKLNTANHPVTVAGNLSVGDGTNTNFGSAALLAGTSTVSIGGNINQNITDGQIDLSSATLVLNGASGNQILQPPLSVNNLTLADTGARTITFPAAAVTTVAGTFTANATLNGVALQSSVSGSQTTITVNGAIGLLDNLTIQDHKINGIAWSTALNPANSLDVGNNAGWFSRSISVADVSIAENGTTAVVTLAFTGTAADNISINYSTSDGTALAGTDYTATSGTLSWSTGGSGNQTFSIPVTDDAVLESAETVNITITVASGSVTLTDPTAILTITDVTIVSRRTLDTDANGKIDQIEMTQSSAEAQSCTGLTVSVVGYSVTGYSSCSETDTVFLIHLAENSNTCSAANQTGCDTGNTPAVQLTASSFSLSEGAASNAADAAKPIYLGMQTELNSPFVTLLYSEPIVASDGTLTAGGEIVYNNATAKGASGVSSVSATGNQIDVNLNQSLTLYDVQGDSLSCTDLKDIHGNPVDPETLPLETDISGVVQADTATVKENYLDYRISQSTEIAFNLSKSGTVTIRILDMRGREVSVLKKNHYSAGTHFLPWNPGNIHPGVYYVHVESNAWKKPSVTKMMLVR